MKSYLRFLSRNKLYTAIEVVGLSVSLAFVIIVGTYAWNMYTLTWDVPDHENIYALNGANYGEASYDMYHHLDKVPEVKQKALYHYSEIFVVGEEDMHQDMIFLVDQEFFNMFPRKVKAGEVGTIDDDGTVIITESLAKMKYGSAEAAVGDKIVFSSFGSKEAPFNEMTVKAVIEDFDNSIFMSGGIVVHYTAGLRISSPIYRPQVFVKTDKNVSKDELSMKVRGMVEEYCVDQLHHNAEYSYADPLDGLLMHISHFGLKHIGTTLLVLLGIIAFMLLLCAILNYINLSFAQTAKRSNEIATMRLVGAQKGEILRQHLKESLLMSTICTLGAILLIVAVTPALNSVIGMIETPFEISEIGLTWRSMPIIIAIALIVGLISGIVPAGLAMSFSPVDVTKGRFRKMRKMVFSKIFIGVNSVIAIILMMMAITLGLSYMKLEDTPLGWNSEDMLFLSRQTYGNGRDDSAFLERLENIPYVKTIGLCDGNIAQNYVMSLNDLQGNPLMASISQVDTTTFRMMGLTQTETFNVPLEGSVWYSESLIERLGVSVEQAMDIDPSKISRSFAGGFSGGIVKDFICCAPLSHASVPFSILHVKSHPYGYNYAIQTTGPHDEAREAILDELKKYCNETRGYYDSAMEFGYAEEFTERSLEGIKMIVAFAAVFMFIALLISMLGLIAMSSYFAGESTKGIAIHKVFGGTVKSEAARNIFKYMKITLTANIIGLPLGYVITGLVLQGVPMVNRLWPLLLTACFIISFSLLSVLWQTLRAARTNPAEALKKE